MIFICMSGSAIAFNWESQHIPAIIQAWYGGQAAGTALADILFGRYNPSGKLPITFYRSDSDLPAIEDYSMKIVHTDISMVMYFIHSDTA